MRLSRSLLVGALGVTAVLCTPATALAAAPTPAPSLYRSSPADSLRRLDHPSGLRIGTAVNTDLLASTPQYAQITAQQFDSVTAENVMKWEVVEPQRGTLDFAAADRLVDFAHANKQRVRGHTLVWHSQLPSWLQATITSTTDAAGNRVDTSSLPASELKALLKKHVQEEVGHFKGRVWQWDVVNEAFNEDGTPRQDVWYQAWGGTGYIADAFRWAHEADPQAKLFYNDYNIEFTGPKSDAAFALAKQLKAQRVPIDGVGFQTHLDTQYGFPDLQANLQRFADLGLFVAETEVDVRSTLPVTAAVQAKQTSYWTQTLQACLAVENCISYTAWGFGDAYSWVPGTFPGQGAANLYDEDLAPKPQYTALQDVLRTTRAPHRAESGGGWA
ncbi:endo-1,4-beta-xylanase [Kineococcus rhizosphaerae]|uniref:Beta-xylanase n=1 Tax=Kineococcus rhizosphaerae TaxID=559628 RepID=A0A2T0R6D6_9ACTN|nr:endo-1,4-beta-xylanase [Kineococcus rhizosphaerae]PRY16717.1 endo-1,4-beta-xylanase [Kineococcus rhizosphaerae]